MVNSVAKLKIGYFLEDRAQENFLKAIVERVAEKEGIQFSAIEHDIRSSTGGAGQATSEFRSLLRRYGKLKTAPFDLLIVAIDGNCKGFNEMETKLRKYAEQTKYPRMEHVVFAIPDPHIERWYLDDQKAFMEAIGLNSFPQIPKYKCKKDIYKQAIENNLQNAGISSILGGSEYGELIVKFIKDLYRLGKEDTSFGHFIDSLSSHFRLLRG